MISFTPLLAHAGEEHSDGLASIAHTASPWYIAILLFIVVISAIGYLAWLVSARNPQITLAVVTFALLIAGFTMFTISAAVSAISITVGLLLAGFQAFTSLIEQSEPPSLPSSTPLNAGTFLDMTYAEAHNTAVVRHQAVLELIGAGDPAIEIVTRFEAWRLENEVEPSEARKAIARVAYEQFLFSAGASTFMPALGGAATDFIQAK